MRCVYALLAASLFGCDQGGSPSDTPASDLDAGRSFPAGTAGSSGNGDKRDGGEPDGGARTDACPPGFLDANPSKPGRDCVRPTPVDSGTDAALDSGTGAALDSSIDAALDSGADAEPVDECPPGFSDVHGDRTVCEDIDECALGTDACDDELCVNVPGSYQCQCAQCACPDGFWEAPGGGCVPQSARLALGETHTCALLDGGMVKCWGSNYAGQLGLNSMLNVGAQPFPEGSTLDDITTAVDLGRAAVMIAAACAHTCALLDDGSVKCWGSNEYGELGQNDTNRRGDGLPRVNNTPAQEMGDNLLPVALGAPAVSVTAGCEYSCALLDDGRLKCWGSGHYGQLGQGNAETLGDGIDEMGMPSDEMGDNLPAIDLSGEIVKIEGGYRFVCAILNGGVLKCWGRNSFGQLGQGNYGDTHHLGDEPDEMGTYLQAVPLGTGRRAVAVTAGYTHTCALLDDQHIKCWGGEYNGGNYTGVGLGDPANRGDAPDEMGDFLDPIDLQDGATAMASGYHSCALLDSGALQCWGQNDSGQLGIGDTEVRGDEPDEMGAMLPSVALGAGRSAVAIEAAQSHTCALLDDGSLKCWGRNTAGQLGIGSAENRGDEPDEMGDALPAAFDLW